MNEYFQHIKLVSSDGRFLTYQCPDGFTFTALVTDDPLRYFGNDLTKLVMTIPIEYLSILAYDWESRTVNGDLVEIGIKLREGADAIGFIRSLIFSKYDERMNEVYALYPQMEQRGWTRKYMQAAQWYALALANDTAGMDAVINSFNTMAGQFAMLLNETFPMTTPATTAQDRQLITDLAGQIVANGFIFETYYGKCSGWKTDRVRELLQCVTAQDYLSLDISFSQVPSLDTLLEALT